MNKKTIVTLIALLATALLSLLVVFIYYFVPPTVSTTTPSDNEKSFNYRGDIVINFSRVPGSGQEGLIKIIPLESSVTPKYKIKKEKNTFTLELSDTHHLSPDSVYELSITPVSLAGAKKGAEVSVFFKTGVLEKGDQLDISIEEQGSESVNRFEDGLYPGFAFVKDIPIEKSLFKIITAGEVPSSKKIELTIYYPGNKVAGKTALYDWLQQQGADTQQIIISESKTPEITVD